MRLLVAVIAAVLVHQWLPPDPRARARRIAGRAVPPLDERLIARWQGRRLRRPGQERTAILLQLLVSELTAGAVPEAAFRQVLGPRHATPSALLEGGPTADRAVWSDVAHLWAAAEDVGFSLATAMRRVHAVALIDQEVAREVQANAAAPRLGLVTMALMPVGAWAMGSMMGAEPLAFLFTTLPGWVCLVLGLACIGLAALWMRSLTRAALA